MADSVIEHPTYMGHVRHFFDEVDLRHMFSKGIDLSTYRQLKGNAERVFFQTRPPNAAMPPDPSRKWSAERSASFRNWMRDNYPIGEPVPRTPQPGTGDRIRKDLRSLSPEEVDRLRTAFRGVMERDPDDPTSYFHLASTHWYPEPNECEHHVDKYNPWHRVYMTEFENALRTVEGCADVTLPYWDIKTPPPALLAEPPFDSYTLPREVHPDYPAGYATSRENAETIAANVQLFGVPGMIDGAMAQYRWLSFNGFEPPFIIAAHDMGHASCGGSMGSADVSSFDPIFWFFHSNWERLWWEWQQTMQATTLWTFRSTLGPLDPADPDADDSFATDFLTPPLNGLAPFGTSADRVIDLSAMGIGYELPASGESVPEPAVQPARFGRFTADRAFRVDPEPVASVRLKGIDRLVIRGSFMATLKADGEPVGRRAFFQSTQPRTCHTCRANPLVNLDFLVESSRITGRALTVDIETVTPAPGLDARVPLYACGNPTLNVRLLLQAA